MNSYPIFKINAPDRTIEPKLKEKIDQKTKPLGALGQLEDMALQVGLIQQTLTPSLDNPHIVVFAGDHGIAKEGVSAYPMEVTYQMVLNFLNGGAAINVLSRQHGIRLKVVDAGVHHDFGEIDKPEFISKKMGYGTSNILYGPAMEKDSCIEAIKTGASIIDEIHKLGCNTIGFGEMGIGNTSSATLLMSMLTGLPIEECVGRGTGLDDERMAKKTDILQRVMSRINTSRIDPIMALREVGGFEMAMMFGAIMKSAELKMVLLVDGFIASSVFLAAYQASEEILEYAIFCHQSDEKGHEKLLEFMHVKPLLHLSMRLGEGTGCAVAMPIIVSAVDFLKSMASFDEAGVKNRDQS